MNIFAGERVSILFIIFIIILLAFLLYGVAIHLQTMLSTTKPTFQAIAQTDSDIKQTKETLPSYDPQLQRENRQEHIEHFQRSLATKFNDIDTYFSTRSLLEKDQQRQWKRLRGVSMGISGHMEELRISRHPYLTNLSPIEVVPTLDIPNLPWDPSVMDIPYVPPTAEYASMTWTQPRTEDQQRRRTASSNPSLHGDFPLGRRARITRWLESIPEEQPQDPLQISAASLHSRRGMIRRSSTGSMSEDGQG